MKVLIVEDEPKIKTETIDDCLSSLGHVSDWAQNQQEANALLAANQYDLVLQDLQIPSRPNGKASPEFGKNLLKQIRAGFGRDLPVILMTAQHQHCVDLMTELQEIGIDGSISKPFPTTGRTLAVVIEDVLKKNRQFRMAAKGKGQAESLTPFPGGVLAYHPGHIQLCGETIAEKSRRGYAWQILQVLRGENDHNKLVHLGSRPMARKLKPEPEQNTLIRAVCSLRSYITKIGRRLGYDCGKEAVIGNDEQGYHLAAGIVVEVYDDNGTLLGQAGEASKGVTKVTAAKPPLKLSDKQRWILARLASEGKLTRREVELEFGISDRTAKRVLGELADAGMVEFDRATHPGFYRLK
ncbi:MAG TPA: response regulator [Phycisphaerae bacterium]|nr:response regulator [Phycisphaerae bacterium]